MENKNSKVESKEIIKYETYQSETSLIDEKNQREEYQSESYSSYENDINELDNSSSKTYNITFVVNNPVDEGCNTPNELILDNTGYDYLYKPKKTKIDGKPIELYFVECALSILNALDSSKILKIRLRDSKDIQSINSYDCLDTPYGFKLSTSIENLGDISKITPNDKNKDGQASITLTQRAFLINRNGRSIIVFNFYFKNTGTDAARNVLFKDILPKGVTLNLGGIYINSCAPSPSDVNIDSQRIFVNMPDIPRGGSATLTLICTINLNTCDEVNLGVVTYVSSFITSESSGSPYDITVKQDMSNIRSISKVKDCKSEDPIN